MRILTKNPPHVIVLNEYATMQTIYVPRRYIRERALTAQLSVHRSTLRRWVEQGRLPAPIQIGPRTVAWDAEEIEQWQAERAAASRKPG